MQRWRLLSAASPKTAARSGCSPRLYSFKIYEGETLMRNFVPCIESATGKAGLYDTVEGKFYGNAGNGAFVTP